MPSNDQFSLANSGVLEMQRLAAPATITEKGLFLVEVHDVYQQFISGNWVSQDDPLGGALVVIGTDWAAILSSASRSGSPTASFSVVGSSIRVTSSGDHGQVMVLARRLCTVGANRWVL